MCKERDDLYMKKKQYKHKDKNVMITYTIKNED